MPDHYEPRKVSIAYEPRPRPRGNVPQRNVNAVVIGVSHFSQSDIPAVQGAEKDAKDFHDLLLELGVPDRNISRLLNEEATRSNVEAALTAIPKDPVSNLIVYIATHGLLCRDVRENIESYVLLHDSQIHGEFPDDKHPYAHTPPTAFSTGEFLKRIHAAPPNHKLLLVDSCYAGNFRWESFENNGGQGLDFATIVMGACGSRELAYGSAQNGRFTSELIRSLRKLSAEEATFNTHALMGRVTGLLIDDPHLGPPQEPQLFCYAGQGSFWFVSPGGVPRLTPQAAMENESRERLEKAHAAFIAGNLLKAKSLASKALHGSAQPEDVRTLLKSIEHAIHENELDHFKSERVRKLLQNASAKASKDWLRAERDLERIGELNAVLESGLQEQIDGIRLTILATKTQEEAAEGASRAARQQIEFILVGYRVAYDERRYEDALRLLHRLRELDPHLPWLQKAMADSTQRCHQDREWAATQMKHQILECVDQRNFAKARELCESVSSLARDFPSLEALRQKVIHWQNSWEQVLGPAQALANSGQYEDALRRLENLDEASRSFPNLDKLAAQWRSLAPVKAERRLHRDGLYYVRLPNGFWLSQIPVTVRAFTQVMRSANVVVETRQRPLEPIVKRTFAAAVSYCRKVDGRLPDSESWTLAGQNHPDWDYPWGTAISRAQAHYATDKLCEVGQYPATPTGFYDLIGNVWEWCSDPGKNVRMRLVRGGSFASNADQLRLSSCEERDTGVAYEDVGFRCMLDEEPQTTF